MYVFTPASRDLYSLPAVRQTHHQRPRLQSAPRNSPRYPTRSLPGLLHPFGNLPLLAIQKYPHNHHGHLPSTHRDRRLSPLAAAPNQSLRSPLRLLHRKSTSTTPFLVHTNQAGRIIRHVPRPLPPNALEQYRRLHQTSHRNGSRFPGILRGKHRRPACVPGKRSTRVRDWMQAHSGVCVGPDGVYGCLAGIVDPTE
jgi:hypothetical protein